MCILITLGVFTFALPVAACKVILTGPAKLNPREREHHIQAKIGAALLLIPYLGIVAAIIAEGL